MNPRRTWLLFSLIRIGLFAVILVILMLLLTPGGVPTYISALLAAAIAFCVSFIFLRKPREEAAKSLYEARASTKRTQASAAGDDESNEDAVVDGSTGAESGSASTGTAAPGSASSGTAAPGSASSGADPK